MSENNIFCNRESIHQTEMLMHHCNAVLQTVTRTRETNLSAITQHCTFIGLVQTTQHRRKGALPRSVFAKQGVYFSGQQIKVHMVVGKNTRETFRYLSGRQCKEGRTA